MKALRAFVLALLLVCAPLAARAQQAESSDAGSYQQLIGEAVGEYNHGNWAEARALFAQAHALYPSARTERGLGLTAFELRDYVDAVDHLRIARGDPRNELSPEQRGQVDDIIARAQRYVGTVRVELVPQSAELLLNGRIVDKGEFVLNVGDYDFAAKAPGYANASLKFNVQGGEASTVRLELVPMSSAIEPPAVHAGAVDQSARSAPEPGATQRILGWTTVGVGVAGAVIGLVFEIERADDVSKRDAICRTGTESDCTERAQAQVDALTGQARTAGTIGTVALIAGAAFTAGGIALLLTAASGERKQQVSVAPIVSPLAQGVMVSARTW